MVQAVSASPQQEHINSLGYGMLYKYPMLDPELTIEAKAIYCYLSSFAGTGSSIFPSRDRILSDLQIGKSAYYKHYRILLENGYITAEQENKGGMANGFTHNTYTIVRKPSKFHRASKTLQHAAVYREIAEHGLQKAGFGFIPRSVMFLPNLSMKAKALYGYYRCFGGVGESVQPEQSHLLFHLSISSKLYRKLASELEAAGLITIHRQHINGRLAANEVFICPAPLRNEEKERRGIVIVQKQDTQKQTAQKQDKQKADSIKNKNNTNNSFYSQSYHEDSVMTRQEKKLTFTEAEHFVHELIDFENREEEYGNTEPFSLCRLFSSALTDLLAGSKGTFVMQKLKRNVKRSGDGGWILMDIEEAACERYEMNQERVRNPEAYMRSCILSELEREGKRRKEKERGSKRGTEI